MRLFHFATPTSSVVPRLMLVTCAALLLLLMRADRSAAHPLGNFSVNHYTLIEVENEALALTYVMDMAEIPTLQTKNEQIDLDRNGTPSATEQRAYQDRKAMALIDNLSLSVNGSELPLRMQRSELLFEAGSGGLDTLRLTLWLTAPLAEAARWEAMYRNNNDLDRLGWKEIVVRGNGAELLEASAPQSDLSQMLRSYPDDLLYQPLAVTHANFTARPAALSASSAQPLTQGVASAMRNQEDGFAALLDRETSSLSGLLLALVAAFVWGAAHAMTPGHGKTVVGAYLVGTRGTARHALFLGLTTTITHTAGVFALGLATLFLSRYFLPEALYPWLSVLSGVLVLGIGLYMIRDRYRAYQHARAHRHGHAHDHDPHHHHEHDHGHCHLPPGAEGEPLGWRSLLALGVSGGLVPCPSALVVLLGAVSLQRVGFGLLLITAFSLGLAGVLTGIGLLLVRARRLFERVPTGGPILRAIPVGSAIVITLIGLGISWQALNKVGALGVLGDLAMRF